MCVSVCAFAFPLHISRRFFVSALVTPSAVSRPAVGLCGACGVWRVGVFSGRIRVVVLALAAAAVSSMSALRSAALRRRSVDESCLQDQFNDWKANSFFLTTACVRLEYVRAGAERSARVECKC